MKTIVTLTLQKRMYKLKIRVKTDRALTNSTEQIVIRRNN